MGDAESSGLLVPFSSVGEKVADGPRVVARVSGSPHWPLRRSHAHGPRLSHLHPTEPLSLQKVHISQEPLQPIATRKHLPFDLVVSAVAFRDHSGRVLLDWFQYLLETSLTTARAFTEWNRFGSFVPMRRDTPAVWFVDGRDYMSAVADALENAKQDIFICDWWLSPEIYLKRPVQGEYWRLDNILGRKAELGVKVFVLLYKEVGLALPINSYHTMTALKSKGGKNIQVLRHPTLLKGAFYWAHHEKVVVIDQTLAFIGGIDLCFGRWDDHRHRYSHDAKCQESGQGQTADESESEGSDETTDEKEGKKEAEEKKGEIGKLRNLRKKIKERMKEEMRRRLRSRRPIDASEISSDVSSLQPHRPKQCDVGKGERGAGKNDEENKEERKKWVEPPEKQVHLWPGHDYTNFIVADFAELHLPYKGSPTQRPFTKKTGHCAKAG
ncbi:unnamed protein product [Darwinula stevensoni]|uniref:phospholipase D n=1 Tax=Darwinula stevensoni TaxID=69355 RepID=A0A7R9FSK2_9CRUS|nr:unnamed protein product [Darwinula stevensoni]CAG0903670.1 unnamed protein product [Darwinula stevensoni]